MVSGTVREVVISHTGRRSQTCFEVDWDLPRRITTKRLNIRNVRNGEASNSQHTTVQVENEPTSIGNQTPLEGESQIGTALHQERSTTPDSVTAHGYERQKRETTSNLGGRISLRWWTLRDRFGKLFSAQ